MEEDLYCIRPPQVHSGEVKVVAVMTSGGDSQGMNAAVRAIVRTGMVLGAKVYCVYGGYAGLVEGNIKEAPWDEVSGYLSLGGTMLGTSRCIPFQEQPEVRKKAVENLVKLRINRLIVIGGDGSLRGANVLGTEWPAHIAALLEEGVIDKETSESYQYLRIAGLPGSIDNDMWGSDLTIGADSALHRVAESLNAISTTASSHQRIFVIEIMGRNCGFLALMSSICSGSDLVFIPEQPASTRWREELIASSKQRREKGSMYLMVIVAEGAIDEDGNPITVAMVHEALVQVPGSDVRMTILGHVQRGGVPSALDRTLSTIMGLVAVKFMLNAGPAEPPVMFGLIKGEISPSPLMECVEKTKTVGALIKEKKFDEAFSLRDNLFKEAYKVHKLLSRGSPTVPVVDGKPHIGILHLGSPSPGMNAAVRAAARASLDKGYPVIGFYNGFLGIADGDGCDMTWQSVSNWSSLGGAILGTNRRSLPSQVGLERVASGISRYNICGLILIGGWDVYTAMIELRTNEEKYPQFKIPVVVIPAAIGNNCPGTDYSIGSDTALNSIVIASDMLKKSGTSSRRRVFIMEVQGANCGYLTAVGGIGGGAQLCYAPETGIHLSDLNRDINMLKTRFVTCKSTSLILNGEQSSKTYTTGLLKNILQTESENLFDVRILILGHIQQGDIPSPTDRVRACLMGVKAVDVLLEKYENGEFWKGGYGVVNSTYKATSYEELIPTMDFEKRTVKNPWWYRMVHVGPSLQHHPTVIKFRRMHDTLHPQRVMHLSDVSALRMLGKEKAIERVTSPDSSNPSLSGLPEHLQRSSLIIANSDEESSNELSEERPLLHIPPTPRSRLPTVPILPKVETTSITTTTTTKTLTKALKNDEGETVVEGETEITAKTKEAVTSVSVSSPLLLYLPLLLGIAAGGFLGYWVGTRKAV